MNMQKKDSLRKLVLMAMLAAVAYLMMAVIRIPVVLFLKYEPKDVVITIGGFLLGPMASMIISGLVSLIEMVSVSDTGIIGCIMNFLSTVSFACTAAVIYKKKRTLNGAVISLLAGSVTMICVMLLWNWLITPLYMGGTRQAVEAMLLPIFLPFNALKAGFNSALVLVLYKPLTSALRKTGLLPQGNASKSKVMVGMYLLGGALLITCILFLLAMQGII
ncbi:MAG: ECF transporter S component [Oscillospiraceae bacterium]|nr:ECF transporter S component [Oscillospiraceae bacterium]MBQ7000236.1 ECF transporter S component [Oscillospiraceae bacterium]